VGGIIAGVIWVDKKIDENMADLKEYTDGHPVFATNPDGGVRSVTYSPDGSRIATASNVTIRIWNAETAESNVSITVVRGEPKPLAFSPDGKHLAIGGFTRLAKGAGDRSATAGGTVWDAATGKKLLSLDEGHTGGVYDIAYSPDGTRLATASYDTTVQVWNADTGEKIFVLKGHSKAVLSVAFSPDGSRLVTGSSDGTARLWDAVTGKEERIIDIKPKVEDKKDIKPKDGEKKEIEPKVEDKKDVNPEDGEKKEIEPKDGDKKEIKQKDADKKEIKPQVVDPKTFEIHRVGFSRDGKQILGAGWSRYWTWDAATGKKIRSSQGQFSADSSNYNTVTINPATSQIAVANDNWVRVFDAKTEQVTHNLRTKPSFSLTISPGQLWCVAISPEGTRVVGGGRDGNLRIWKLNE